MTVLARLLLLCILATACQSSDASTNCVAFHQSEQRLKTERDQAQAAWETSQSGFISPTRTQNVAADRAKYEQATRAYAELYAGDTACSTPEDRARARADLEQK